MTTAPGTRSGDYLRYYAQHFNAVEVNSTYYRIPHPRVLEMMQRKTPPGFHFVVKLNQAMTHQQSRERSLYRDFLAVLEPLKAAGKYDGVLAQFPWGFKKTKQNFDHIDTLSMGTTNELEAAIAAGSTLVRIGTAIFGPRNYN